MSFVSRCADSNGSLSLEEQNGCSLWPDTHLSHRESSTNGVEIQLLDRCMAWGRSASAVQQEVLVGVVEKPIALVA